MSCELLFEKADLEIGTIRDVLVGLTNSAVVLLVGIRVAAFWFALVSIKYELSCF